MKLHTNINYTNGKDEYTGRCAFPARLLLLMCIFSLMINVNAKTRWSTFHCIPDADLIDGGALLFDVAGYVPLGQPDGVTIQASGILTLGIIEWVNVYGGYAGGPTFGLKARLLGETANWMPSLALGVKNLFSHEEIYWYNVKNDSLSNEVYCALGKSIENLRLRINIGVQSIPENKRDKVNPFAGVEKYFGNGLYVSFEFFRRQKEYVMALFADWRILKRRLEIYTGVVHIAGLFSGENKDETLNRFVQPGIRSGLRFYLNMNKGKSEGFTTLEDRLSLQNRTIETMEKEIDSIKILMFRGSSRIESISKSLKELSDSAESDNGRYRDIVIEKLAALKNLYEQEPFEPEQVKIALRGLLVHRDNILPALLEISLNRKEITKIRTLAIAACGEIGTSTAADILIEVLGQIQIPELKIEALIALGKLKEVRAAFLMQQLAADPNDAVAFTASEVLQKLEKETGIPLYTTPAKPSPVLSSIPENKIGERSAGNTGLNEVIEETSVLPTDSIHSIQKVEKNIFSEASLERSEQKSSGSDTVSKKTDHAILKGDINPTTGISPPNPASGKDTTNFDVVKSTEKTVVDSITDSRSTIQQDSTQVTKDDKKKEKAAGRKSEETGDW